MEYRINVVNKPWLQEKIDKLNKRAVKLGLEPLELAVKGQEVVEVKKLVRKSMFDKGEYVPTGEVQIFETIELIGKAPVIDGWQLACVLENTGNSENIVRALEMEEIPVQYRHSGTICEHCGINRYRKDTFLVRNIYTWELKQVGRSCLKDFLGHDPDSFLRFAQQIENIEKYLSEMESPEFTGYVDHRYIDVDTYLSFVVKVVRESGKFITKREAYELECSSTAHLAHSDMFPIGSYVPEQPTNEDKELAKQAREWLIGQESDDNNDYMHNCITFAKNGYCEWRDTGFVASIISTYQRHLEQELKRKQAQSGTNEYVGTVGQREQFDLTLVQEFEFDTMYGHMYLYKFIDGQGHTVIWKTSKGIDIDNGQSVQLTGTIKEHSEYRGEKQTVLTRCKVLQAKGA